ncbi:MAG: STAS domain-containing protein [Sulfitobacter sp.]
MFAYLPLHYDKVISRRFSKPNRSYMLLSIQEAMVGSQFELQLAKTLRKNRGAVQSIHVDLTHVTFMDCYSAQVLISYLTAWDRNGISTTISLPEKKSVRDIMRVWNFDDALKAATGRRMYRFSDDETRQKYFFPNDSQSTFDLDEFPTHYKIPTNDDGDDDESIRPNFFGFRTIKVPSNVHEKPELANDEKRFWQNHNVKTLLERDLGIDVRYFSARVIFEAVFNALRHPSAEIVQTATHTRYIYDRSQQLTLPFNKTQRNKKQASKSAVVHYWDNGRSLLDLIEENLATKKTFRTSSPGKYFRSYRLKWKNSESKSQSIDRVVGSDLDAEPSSHISEKLLFVLQPFVSMSPTLFGHASTEETTEDDPRLASVGMGLYLLLDTAVANFGGKVIIRTSNVIIRVTKGKKSKKLNGSKIKRHDYVVDIQELPNNLPKFLGNLISISIPEQEKQ